MGGFCSSQAATVTPIAICARPGCTNPSWNGAPGEYCSKKCRPVCLNPGCGKPTWNGQPGEYCGHTCKAACQPPPPPAPTCSNPGCGKPTWNGQPNEFCSQTCRSAASSSPAPPAVATCATPGCGKPTWNGKPGGYCSLACKNGQAAPPVPRHPSHPGLSSTASGGASGFLCLRPGCGKLSFNGQPANYCSPCCRDLPPPICVQMGCGKPTWNGQLNDYCSKVCRDTRVCVRPGCGRPTWNGAPNEFCSRSCRLLGPPHEPVVAAVVVPAGPQSVLVEVKDQDVLNQFQLLLDATRKDPPNNWTRDRGCSIHGRGDPNCSMSCAYSNQVPVPTRYELVKVEMNMNQALWAEYSKARDEILQECSSATSTGPPYLPVQVETSPFMALGQAVGCQPLVDGCNEWRLFHGSSRQACEGICESDFAVKLAGTGATWKQPGKGKGQPLYGYGVYLAERITKADEYATPEAGDLCTVLLCRVLGGRARVITSNHIDLDRLKQDITSGAYDSVVGDRVTTQDKPFREVVVYTNDQVLPEFIITYRRL